MSKEVPDKWKKQASDHNSRKHNNYYFTYEKSGGKYIIKACGSKNEVWSKSPLGVGKAYDSQDAMNAVVGDIR